jgi:hypothetical protein
VLSGDLLQWAIGGEPAALRGVAAKPERRFAGTKVGVAVERDETWALADPDAPTAAGLLSAVETYATAAEANVAAGRRGLVVTRAEETIA